MVLGVVLLDVLSTVEFDVLSVDELSLDELSTNELDEVELDSVIDELLDSTELLLVSPAVCPRSRQAAPPPTPKFLLFLYFS